MQGQLHRISKRVLWIFEERFCIIQEWFQSMKRCTAENSPVEIPDHEKMHQRVRRIHQFEERQPPRMQQTGAENSPVEISEYERTHERVRIFHQLKSRLCIIQESSSWRGEFTSWNSKRITGCGEIRLRTPISDHELHQGHRFTNSRRGSRGSVKSMNCEESRPPEATIWKNLRAWKHSPQLRELLWIASRAPGAAKNSLRATNDKSRGILRNLISQVVLQSRLKGPVTTKTAWDRRQRTNPEEFCVTWDGWLKITNWINSLNNKLLCSRSNQKRNEKGQIFCATWVGWLKIMKLHNFFEQQVCRAIYWAQGNFRASLAFMGKECHVHRYKGQNKIKIKTIRHSF